jgi:uncharacterized protein (TIGR03382 family)
VKLWTSLSLTYASTGVPISVPLMSVCLAWLRRGLREP